MNQRSHEEIQELLGAYALHAVEPDEIEMIERHLEDCPRCRAEVAGHREVATLLGNSGGDAPEGLWDRIADQLEEAPPPMRLTLPDGPGTVVPLAPRRRPRREGFATRMLAAAAAFVIVALGAQVLRQGGRIDDLESAMSGSTVADASLATLASEDGSLSAEAVLLSTGTGYLLADDLPGLTEEQTYQLWGMTDHGLISLGLLGAEPGDVVPFQAGGGQDVSGLAITAEIAGGVTISQNAPVVLGEFG